VWKRAGASDYHCTLNSAIIFLAAAFLPQRKTGPVFGPIEQGGERPHRWKKHAKSSRNLSSFARNTGPSYPKFEAIRAAGEVGHRADPVACGFASFVLDWKTATTNWWNMCLAETTTVGG
jgi:hypothetical protein